MPIDQLAAHIEVENLEIHYGPVAAVGPVSFTVMPGQQVTLLGPSGCGKTTTLRAVAGLEKPSAGAIRIGDRVMYDGRRGINLPAAARREVASRARAGADGPLRRPAGLASLRRSAAARRPRPRLRLLAQRAAVR